MTQINEGLAKDGMAWFSNFQTAGKGQRGKAWVGNPDENIALTIAFESLSIFQNSPFLFNALISLEIRSFLQNIINESILEREGKENNAQTEQIDKNVHIKWPNDLWVNDRKAGGVLIENKYRGNNWNWAVVGIGINVNQILFSEDLKMATSLKQITQKNYNPEYLARRLHQKIAESIIQIDDSAFKNLMSEYNYHLYKRGSVVKFKKENTFFESTVVGVNEKGFLLTQDEMEREFQFGEIEWCLQ